MEVNILLGLLWIVVTLAVITSVVFFAKREGVTGLVAIYVGLVITASIAATKILNLFGIYVPGGTIVYSATFLVTDIISECYGRKYAKTAVHSGLLAMAFYFLYSYVTVLWPAAPFYQSQDAFTEIVGLSARVSLAGLLAFYISQRTDILIFHIFKDKHGSGKLWFRNLISTGTSQLIDTALFTIIAFMGIFTIAEMLTLILSTYIIKLIIALLDTPFVYLARTILNKKNI